MRMNRNAVYTPAGTPEAHAVQRALEWLDDIAAGYEAKWGVDRLQKLANDELRQKWENQIGKLNDAIDRNHPADVEALAQSTVRGWKVLEDHALQNGCKPLDPDAWECWHPSGTVYRVAKNNAGAHGVQGRSVVTLASLVNIYHAVMTGKLDVSIDIKKQFEIIPMPEDGDDLPW